MANTQQTRAIFQNSNSSSEKNWAFVDMQNFYKGIREKGWKINWAAFRNYLKTTHAVSRAVAFMGYIYENEYFYRLLRNAGFLIEFRQVRKLDDGSIDGGNVDADLACYALDNKVRYSKAIIVADDGDYCKTVQTLQRQNKLKLVISSHPLQHSSQLIKQTIGCNMMLSIHDLKSILAQHNTITIKN